MNPAGYRCAALVLVAAALLGGCNRSFTAVPSSPSSALLPLGDSCADAGACASSFCVDSVCCATECDDLKRCDVAGAVGTCSPLALGSSCTIGTACQSGNCVDGVCCDSLCAASCYTCNQPGDAGQCLPAADDTDPRDNCGFCAACFGGVCNPAIAGSDPHGDCTTPPGQTCAGGACLAQEGAYCDADDYACAVGFCIGWACVDYTYVRIDTYPFLPIDQIRNPLSVSVDSEGAALMAVTLDGSDSDGNPVGTLVALMAPDVDGPWSALALDYTAPIPAITAVAMVGDIAYFAVANGAGLQDTTPDPGIYVEGFRVDGTYVSDVQINEEGSLALSSVNSLALAAESDGRLLLGGAAPDAGLQVSIRGTDGNWSSPLTVSPTADGVAGATVGGHALLVYASNGQVHVLGIDGVDHGASGAPPGCSGNVALAASAAHETAGDVLSFVVTCAGQIQWGVYDPQPNAGTPWTFIPAPVDLPGTLCVTGLPDPDPACPVAQYVPVGGFGDAVLYASFTPGDVTNGFTTIYSVAPDAFATDGGYYTGSSSTPDTGFSFLTAVGTSNPQGDPVLLLGSAVVSDGGPSADGELLIQDWYLFNP